MDYNYIFLIFVFELLIIPLLLFISYRIYTNYNQNRNRIIVDNIIREINREHNTEILDDCNEENV